MNKNILLIFCIVFSSPAISFWESLFNENFQGYTEFKQQKYASSYEKFTDPHWKALAALKNNKLEDSIDLLVDIKTITGKYNLGTAYALQGDFDNAINVYRDVLKIDPGHADAKYNLELVEKLKKQSENSKKDGKNGKGDNNSKDSKDSKNGDSSNSKKNKDDKAKQNETDPKDKNPDKQDQEDTNTGKQKKDKKQQQNTEKLNSSSQKDNKYDEKQQADEQWLRSIPDDPGGLLKNKFLRDHLKRRGELR